VTVADQFGTDVSIVRGVVDYQAAALKWYSLMAARDWTGLRSLVHPDIEFTVARGFPAGGRYRGANAVFEQYFPAASESWESLTPVIDEVIPAGECTVVLGRYVGVTRATGTSFDVEFAHLWRSDGERLTNLRQYVDTAVFRDRVSGVTD
jgi:ketosteroid isomerase-like protein